MKATLLLLAPAMALAGSNITTTCQSVSIDSSSGVLSAMCNDTSEAQYFSQLDLNQCLGYNKTLISEANGDFAQNCSSLAIVGTPKANTLDASCGPTGSMKATSFDLTTLVTNSAGCIACLSAKPSLCMTGSGFGVGPGSTGSGTGSTGGSSFGGSGSSGGSSFSGSNGGSSSTNMKGQSAGLSSSGLMGSRFRA